MKINDVEELNELPELSVVLLIGNEDFGLAIQRYEDGWYSVGTLFPIESYKSTSFPALLLWTP